MKNELLGNDERVWTIRRAEWSEGDDLDAEESILDPETVTYYVGAPKITDTKVVPKSELDRVNKVNDMQALLVSEYQELICEFLGMKNGNRKLSPHDAKILLSQYRLLHEKELQKLKGGV